MPTWIPRSIMTDIMRVVRTMDRSSHVFYITGEGGVGKTILLRQIGMELGSPDGMQPAPLWSGVLDLYHPHINSNSGLETKLSAALGAAGQFQEFHDERDGYANRRKAGLPAQELEQDRTRMAEIFAQCMNNITSSYRIVIALDTTERIQYERDETQLISGLTNESTTVKAWLLDQLKRWQNCVVLLVGRPEQAPFYLQESLENELDPNPNVRYWKLTLGGFDELETQAYVANQSKDMREFLHEDSFLESLWKATEGRPIRLDLALDVIQNGVGADRLRAVVKELSPEAALHQIDEMLIKMVMEGEPDSSLLAILRFLAIARRGLDADLLHHLVNSWSVKECQERLKQIETRSFVKVRPEDGRYFLHDEMYDLCDHYILQPDAVQKLSQKVVTWYDERVAKYSAVDTRQNHIVDSLLYRLRANPVDGYQWYAKEAESAIRASEVGFDMRLRTELLAFLKSKSQADRSILPDAAFLRREVACDEAARWVKRYMVRGQNDLAVRVAESVLNRPEGMTLCPQGDPQFQIACADLLVYYAQALIYSGRRPEAVEKLQQVIANLQGDEIPEDLAIQDADSYMGWRRNHVLGRGYNNLGYAYWRQGHLSLALDQLPMALPYFRASDLKEETANTADNMGRVYAMLSKRNQAETLVDDGLRIRSAKGQYPYRKALSLNSRAIVHLAFEQPHRARSTAEQALDICEDIDTRRGIGLCCITLGQAWRHIGALWKDQTYSAADSKKHLGEAVRYLERAIKIFEEQVEEPERLIEAYNEIGCVYREQAAIARSDTNEETSLDRIITREAIRYLTQAINLAKERYPIFYVDSCQDLAETYFQRGDIPNAEAWIKNARQAIPPEYQIQPGIGLPDISVDERVEEYWQNSGKLELLQGHIVYGHEKAKQLPQETLKKAVQHHAFAVVYFERFSREGIGLTITLRQLHDRFKYFSLEELRYIQQELLPELATKNKIDVRTIIEFLDDTLGLAGHRLV